MSMDADGRDRGDGHVIVSFDVFSPKVIQELADYSSKIQAPTDSYRYRFETTTFDEPELQLRAAKLESTINDYLDRLQSVPRDVLHGQESFVRLYVSIPAGAETINARTVQRLAEANATIWIDA